jgi:phosphate-selective porin OprO/OprP
VFELRVSVSSAASFRRRRVVRANVIRPGRLRWWRVVAAAPAVGRTGALARQEPEPVPPEPTLERTIEAGESGVQEPRRKLVRWNEFDGPLSTFKFGAGILYEYAAYAQDEQSKQQFTLEPEAKVRDFRFLFKGRLKTERPVTWTCGVMYDGPSDAWLVRETGVMIAVPELWGHFFIGRTKEGVSLNKVMTGYSGWTMERATITDATIPILADGVKWLGYVPERGLIWNIGWYHDWLSEHETFSSYDSQFVARVAWLPIASEASGTLLHVGVNGRYGKPDEGELRLRARPEAFPAPYFVDTEKFPAGHSTTASLEAYYRPGPLLIGSEYFVQKVAAPEAGDPFFHGGDIVVSWLATGETRAYNTVGGYFKSVSPARTVFEGGPGAWELIARISYIDLDGGTLRGGKFWRFTPMVNWHLSDHLRLEFAYGYGTLDRFDLTGDTQFFQSRIQFQF